MTSMTHIVIQETYPVVEIPQFSNKYLPTPKSKVITIQPAIELPVITFLIHEEHEAMFEHLIALHKLGIKAKTHMSHRIPTGKKKWLFFDVMEEVPTTEYYIEYVNYFDLERGFLHHANIILIKK
jgi:hypothetical protein